MRLAICDDNLEFCKIEKDIMEKNGIRGDMIDIFLSGQTLLEAYQQRNYQADVVFMDIEIDQENGIEIGKQLNQIAPNLQIAYVTNYLRYVTDVYQTNHCYYVLKEELERRVPELLRKVQEQKQEKKLLIKDVKQNQYLILARNIKYIERNMRQSDIHLKDGDEIISTKEKLSTLIEKLPKNEFIRCHNSYIVSLNHVQQLHRTEFVIGGDIRIPISRANLKHTKELFMNWAAGQL